MQRGCSLLVRVELVDSFEVVVIDGSTLDVVHNQLGLISLYSWMS